MRTGHAALRGSGFSNIGHLRLKSWLHAMVHYACEVFTCTWVSHVRYVGRVRWHAFN